MVLQNLGNSLKKLHFNHICTLALLLILLIGSGPIFSDLQVLGEDNPINPEYVIITGKDWMDIVQPLAEWKTDKEYLQKYFLLKKLAKIMMEEIYRKK